MTTWEKIGLPNPPEDGKYVLGSLHGEPISIETTTTELEE